MQIILIYCLNVLELVYVFKSLKYDWQSYLSRCKLYDACNIGKCSAGTFHLTGVIWVCSIVAAMQMSAVVKDNGHF